MTITKLPLQFMIFSLNFWNHISNLSCQYLSPPPSHPTPHHTHTHTTTGIPGKVLECVKRTETHVVQGLTYLLCSLYPSSSGGWGGHWRHALPQYTQQIAEPQAPLISSSTLTTDSRHTSTRAALPWESDTHQPVGHTLPHKHEGIRLGSDWDLIGINV